LTAADATYRAAQRITRHPWRPSGANSVLVGGLVREAGFGIAGPQAREVKSFLTVVAFASFVGSIPVLRRAAHKLHVEERKLHVEERRVGEKREEFWGSAAHSAAVAGPAGE
jgi:hypothetical protein